MPSEDRPTKLRLLFSTIATFGLIAALSALAATVAKGSLVTPHETKPQVVTPQVAPSPAASAPSATSAPSGYGGRGTSSGPVSASSPATGPATAPSQQSFSAGVPERTPPALQGPGQTAVVPATPRSSVEQELMRAREVSDWLDEQDALRAVRDSLGAIFPLGAWDTLVPETIADLIGGALWGNIVVVPGSQRPGAAWSPDDGTPTEPTETPTGDAPDSTPTVIVGFGDDDGGSSGSKPLDPDDPGFSQK